MKKYSIIMMVFLMAIVMGQGLISCGDDEMTTGLREYEEVIDDDGIPKGKGGDESMFGYYCYTGTFKNNYQLYEDELVRQDESWGNPGVLYNEIVNANDHFYLEDWGIRIVDEHVFHGLYCAFVPGYLNNSFLVASHTFYVENTWGESIRFSNGTSLDPGVHAVSWYLYMTPEKDRNNWEGRYSMDGTTMLVNTEDNEKNHCQWTYENGTIVVTTQDGYKMVYEKVK